MTNEKLYHKKLLVKEYCKSKGFNSGDDFFETLDLNILDLCDKAMARAAAHHQVTLKSHHL